jgi:hypothetical protein
LNTSTGSRWRAGGLHLGATIAVMALLGAAYAFVWVTPLLWPVTRIEPSLVLLFAAALVVGPVLTTLVYKHGKPSLRSDLIVVVLIQVILLGYALAMLARTRPAFIVATADHLQVVQAREIDPNDLAAAAPAYRDIGWTGPRMVGLRADVVSDRRETLFYAGIDGSATVQPALYVDFAQTADLLRLGASPVDRWIAQSGNRERIDGALAASGRKADAIRVVPINTSSATAAALVDAKSGRPLRVVRKP